MTKGQHLTCFFFCLLLALIPVVSVFVQRSAGYMPGLAGLVGCLSVYFAFHMRPRFPLIALGAVLSISVLALLSSLWSVDVHRGWQMAMRATAVMLSGILLITAVQNLDVAALKKYLWLIPSALVVAAILIVIDQKSGNPIYRFLHGHLPPSEHINRSVYNRASSIIILMLLPSMAIFIHHLDWKRMTGLLAVSVLPLLIVTDSQSAQLALGLALILWGFFPYGHKQAWYVFAGLIFALALAAPFISIWMYNHIAQAMEAIPMLGTGGAYSGARLEIWDYISRYALKSPLYGFGMEATRNVQGFDSAEIYQKGNVILHPHNFMLQIWIEFGVIGALLMASLLSGFILLMQRTLIYTEARIALPSLVACLSIASTGYGIWQAWWIGTLFTVSAICILAIRLDRDKLGLPVTIDS